MIDVFYKDLGNAQGALVAYHDETQTVPAADYGADIKIISVSSLDSLERIGDAPFPGSFDGRPFKIPSLSIEDLRLKARTQVFEQIAATTQLITSQYTQAEMLSWTTKDTAARAYLAGETLTDTQNTLLQSELTASQKTDMKILCNSIVANADAFAHIAGTLAGLRTSALSSINEATTENDITAVLANVDSGIRALAVG